MVVRILATRHPDVRIIWEANDVCIYNSKCLSLATGQIYNAAREPNLDQGLEGKSS
jgi:hypothetical protein